jgi:hypothetical protein
MSKFTNAIEKSKIDIVPKTVVNMGSGQGQGSSVNAFEMLIGLLVSDKLGVKFDQGTREEDPRVAGIKESIMKTIEQGAQTAADTKKPSAPAKEI